MWIFKDFVGEWMIHNYEVPVYICRLLELGKEGKAEFIISASLRPRFLVAQ